MRLSPGRLPIRTRLALIYTALLVTALAAFGGGTYLVLRSQLLASFDDSLMANAEHAAGAFAQDVGADGVLRPTARLVEQFAATGGRLAIVDTTGRTVTDSGGPGATPLPLPPRSLLSAGRDHSIWIAGANGETLRITAAPIASAARVAGYVLWAASTSDTESLLRTVALALIGGGLLLAALAFGAGWLLAGRALAPIADVTETARSISLSGDFDGRVHVAGPAGDEVGELAVAFNEMLGALAENHKALQRFLGDASHQLRTPLTTLRASLELIDRPGLPAAEREELIADARAETERMARLVADLLSLARAESGARLEFAPVEVDAILLEAVRQVATAAGRVRVEVGAIEPAVVQGDRDRLKELLLIVLDNAVRYTPVGGRVRADLRSDAGAVRIVVADTGIGISEAEREHVFERLFRGAEARRVRPAGTGLGLAIAAWIVDAHGGSIDLRRNDPAGTAVEITLPASP